MNTPTCHDRHFPHAPDPNPLFPAEPYYRVSIYWGMDCCHPAVHANGGWKVRWHAAKKWELRRALRRLYEQGWDRETILVERITPR